MVDSDIMLKVAKNCVSVMREHFDSVHVVGTAYDCETGETTILHTGAGDFYARMGAVQKWLSQEDALTRNSAVVDDDED